MKSTFAVLRHALYKSAVSKKLAELFCTEIFYINGADRLPPPLDAQREAELMSCLDGEEGVEARKELIEHNLRLVVYIARKFENTGVFIEDLISIGTIGLIKAVNTFCPNKNIKLATYASRCIENEILMLLRSNKKHITVDSLDDTPGDSDDNDITLIDTIPQKEEDGVFCKVNNTMLMQTIDEIMKNKLTEREYFVIKYRYGLNSSPAYTQREVADMLNISRSYISRIEKKALQILRASLDKDVFID